MPTNVTEVDEFTATVPVPNDLEDANGASVLAMAQPLTNRSLYLKNIVDELRKLVLHAEFAPSGAWTTLSKLGLTIGFNATLNAQTFSVASGDITVPYAGRYVVSGHLHGVAGSPNVASSPVVRVNTTDKINMFVNANVADSINVYRDAHFEGIVEIADPTTDKINIYNPDANTIDLANGSARLNVISVRYIGPIP